MSFSGYGGDLYRKGEFACSDHIVRGWKNHQHNIKYITKVLRNVLNSFRAVSVDMFTIIEIYCTSDEQLYDEWRVLQDGIYLIQVQILFTVWPDSTAILDVCVNEDSVSQAHCSVGTDMETVQTFIQLPLFVGDKVFVTLQTLSGDDRVEIDKRNPYNSQFSVVLLHEFSPYK